MKTLRHIFPVLSLLATLLVSCIAEPVTFSDREDEQEVRITVNTGTRAEDGPGTPAGDPEDRYINSLRILGYRISDGSLAFNKSVSFVGTADENKESREWDVEVLTGKFNIVFIANEHSDATASSLLAAITSTTNHSRSYLQENVTFSHEAFSALKDIPMVTLKEEVHIKADYQLKDPDQTVNGGSWSVMMERLGVRIDLTLTLEIGQSVEETEKLSITKIPKKVYLFNGQYNDSENSSDYVSKEFPYITPTTTNADNKDVLEWKRIILPESMFDNETDKDKAMKMAIKVNGEECITTIGKDVDKDTEEGDRDYTLPRNTYLDISATANVSDNEIICTATILPWGDVSQKVIIDEQFYLTVDEDELFLSEYINTKTFIAETNYEIDDRGFPSGVKVEKEAGCNWITGLLVTYNGNENYTVSITSAANTASTLRTAKVYVKAGNMSKVINVTQSGILTLIHHRHSYVGAFWRANQTGERLIRFTTTKSIDGTNYNDAKGNWHLSVYDYGDDFKEGDIIFSTNESSDFNVYGSNPVDMNIDANDAIYGVNGNTTSLSGSITNDGDEIFFRIGLKSKWSPTASKPARYAVLILTYNNDKKYQKIWLRQGEGADYIMYTGDMDENGNIAFSGRNHAMKWSPYNLTSNNLKDASPYYDQMDETRKGVFTDYPSQAGAFFQWANENSGYERIAYHPTYDGKYTWNRTNYENWQWDSERHETCPEGYRRPSVSLENNYQDFYQSFISMEFNNLGNSVSGYYADGFFDRLTPETATGQHVSGFNADKTVVANGTINAAYIGRLIYNPVSDSQRKNASIFIPAAGVRVFSDGHRNEAGYYGCSWMSIRNNTINLNIFNIFNNQTATKSAGLTIRCVVEEPSYQ